jgi:geranylgeranyl diphosphate synthase, type II
VGAESELKAYAERVEARLDRILPPLSATPTELHAAMRYAALSPGKRLRPALCIAAAEAVGGDSDSALDPGCAIEMVHCFSLVHDDLPAIDDDDLRRGLPTVHVKYGEAVAILAGDALFALAFDTLAAAPGAPDQVLESVRVLTRAVGSEGLVGGETVDVLSEGRDVSAETLAWIHDRKTGALISASCEIGALFGGADTGAREALREYGKLLGLAFQIADDVLNETGTPQQLGKSAGSDRERKKATYPARFGLDASRDMARDAVERAIQAVRDLPHSSFLQDLARFSVERVR